MPKKCVVYIEQYRKHYFLESVEFRASRFGVVSTKTQQITRARVSERATEASEESPRDFDFEERRGKP